MSSPNPCEPAAPSRRPYESVARVLALQFGLDLRAYSTALVDMVLDTLPSTFDAWDPEILRRLLTAFGIGETSFLRHAEHFAALRSLLPSLPGSQDGCALRVWSAGCATGEEAYSLAAVLGAAGVPTCQVLGSDVNAASIDRATDGIYRLWSLRGVRLAEAESWLDIGSLQVRVRDSVRPAVRFDVRNLVKDSYPSDLDVVFCRNVLLYFRSEAAERVYERMERAVRPGGVLFIGYGDPEPCSDSWKTEYLRGVRYFRRRPKDVAPSRPAEHAAPRSLPPTPISRHPSSRPPVGDKLEGEDAFSIARGLAGQRDFDQALALLHRLVQTQDFALAVEGHVLTAMIAEEAQRLKLCLDAARRAHFLAPTEPVPLYLLGSALDCHGDTELARDRLAQARHALQRHADLDAPLPHGEGLTGRQLRRMIRARLDR